MKKLGAGKILIAEPFLGDPNFERTVILLCDHNEKGSFGLVLNHETDISVGDLVPGKIISEQKIFFGGPVERNTLHFIHTNSKIINGGLEIVDGLFWGGNFDEMVKWINLGVLKPSEIRFFVGYSGWSGGQLEMEMKRNSWIISKTNSENIMNIHKDFWRDSLKKMGGDFKVMANYPVDPRLN